MPITIGSSDFAADAEPESDETPQAPTITASPTARPAATALRAAFIVELSLANC